MCNIVDEERVVAVRNIKASACGADHNRVGMA